MRSFNKLYKELMESLSSEREYILGQDKKPEESSFCIYRPEINNFAFKSPKNMFIVIAFVIFTIQRDWPDVTVRFPLFLKWFFEKVLDKSGIIQNVRYGPDEEFVKGTKIKTRAFGPEHRRLVYIWNNREQIFRELSELRENEFGLLNWILDNIEGLSLVKSGFLVQLITGKYGCIDSINTRVLNKILKSPNFDYNKAKKNQPKYKQMLMDYVDAVNELESKTLWNDWCEIVAKKIQFAAPKSEVGQKKIKTILPNDKGYEEIQPYIIDKANEKNMEKAKKRFLTGMDVGKDHWDLFGDSPYRESFDQQYEMLMKEYVEDFDQKWDKAVSESEELQVALDLMKNIKKKIKGEIYIVGGVPRDLLMGNAIDDVDLATNIPVKKLEKHFELRNISKNDSQPVYAILWKGYVYDLAKFRTDSGDIGRQANVSTETDSFQADTERRDLTINSFGLDENGKIVDYQGGLDDLKNKIVRAVGDAKKRFMEDATRILRVFRFAAKMDFEIEENTKKAAIELKHLLQDPKAISKESISKEFYKSAKTGRTLANFLKKLQDTKILHDILPEFTQMEGFDHDPQHHPEGDSQVLGHIYECLNASPYKDPIINLAVLFHDFGKATTRGKKDNGFSSYHGHEAAGVPIVEGIFERLKFNELSQQDKKNILAAVDKHMLVHNLDKLNIKTLTRLIQNPAWETIKAVGYCDEASRGSGLFNEQEFWDKVKRAEEKVSKIGGSEDETRKRLKQYFSGNKLMEWFPVLVNDKSKFKDITSALQEYTLEELNAGREPKEEEMKTIAAGILKNNQFNEWYNYYQRN